MNKEKLVGNELDEAVAYFLEWSKPFPIFIDSKPVSKGAYSTDWAKGGPIIEREKITLDLTDVLFDHNTGECIQLDKPEWWASMGDITGRGQTPLIAAMRCYVASKQRGTE